jgi:prevent-host-death family protein
MGGPMDWKLAEAKNRLSEVVTRAVTEGPQTIRRHDAAVVVVAEDTYLALAGKKPTFKGWLLNGPRTDALEVSPRDQSPMRDVEL